MNKLFSTLRYGFFAMITLGFLALTPSAQAVTLNVVGGQLLGASGVDVGGTLYDVEFLDGSCVALFGGCDDISDFAFQTQADAALAAQSLLDDVFIDGAQGSFGSSPALTRGISSSAFASIVIPHGFFNANTIEFFTAFITPTFNITGGAGTFNVNTDLSDLDGFTYSRFSPTPLSVVPLPPAGILFGSGLIFLVALSRRARKRAQA